MIEDEEEAVLASSMSQETPISIEDLPSYRTSPTGELLGGVMIDYWCYVGSQLVVSGWAAGEDIPSGETTAIKGVAVCTFRRPDVELAFPSLQSKGILAALSTTNSDSFILCGHRILLPNADSVNANRSRLWAEHRERLGFILRNCSENDSQLQDVVSNLQPPPPWAQRARGYIEQAKGVPGCGGLVIGWAVTLPGTTVALIDASGRLCSMERAIRWHRPDIVDACGSEFGNFTFNAGFLQSWKHPLQLGEPLRLVSLDGDGCYVLAILDWEAAPIEPTSFARWAFDFPTPLDKFYERLDYHDGEIIQALITSKLANRESAPLEITYLGPTPTKPTCSIIIPLYGRFDFMMNQLLEMSDDPYFKKNVELIYVIDDPRIASQVKQSAWLLYEANQIPFQLVSSRENRGFSGANNLGFSVSRAPYTLLLNSDVIPVEPGWIEKMIAAFEQQPDVGIVGARLFYPNGSLQHDGMMFFWDPNWNAYLNKHPRAGLEPLSLPSEKAVRKLAVTAACLMLKRSTYEEVGGLDEGFLIGDFEDSDLCLKVRAQGLEILMIENINLIHLERQSFVGIGLDRFREQVARYNAWRHQHRWGNYIDQSLAGATVI